MQVEQQSQKIQITKRSCRSNLEVELEEEFVVFEPEVIENQESEEPIIQEPVVDISEEEQVVENQYDDTYTETVEELKNMLKNSLKNNLKNRKKEMKLTVLKSSNYSKDLVVTQKSTKLFWWKQLR